MHRTDHISTWLGAVTRESNYHTRYKRSAFQSYTSWTNQSFQCVILRLQVVKSIEWRCVFNCRFDLQQLYNMSHICDRRRHKKVNEYEKGRHRINLAESLCVDVCAPGANRVQNIRIVKSPIPFAGRDTTTTTSSRSTRSAIQFISFWISAWSGRDTQLCAG